jgi:hypothetical protein
MLFAWFVLSLLLSLLLLVTTAANTVSNSSHIYVIRHGEKKWALGCLSKMGEARANALPSIFNSVPSAMHETFFVPDFVYANLYDDSIDCERCVETVTPLAFSLNKTVNESFGYSKKLGGNILAAQVIIQRTAGAPGTVVLAAWEHINIQYFVEAMGVSKNQIPTWKGSDYDTVYVMTMDAHGKLVQFHVAHENFTDTGTGT